MVLHEMVHYNFNAGYIEPEPVKYTKLRLPHLENTRMMKRTGSFVVGQKLRESKWFTHEETKVLCAVLETGFIVETKNHNEERGLGVAVWTPGYEKSKDPRQITIYTTIYHKGRYKIKDMNLLEFWPNGTKLRINNQNDKNESPNDEEKIRHQVNYAMSAKQKWHNIEHFPYFCRYQQPINFRTKHISDKWTFGLTAGLVLFKRARRQSTK